MNRIEGTGAQLISLGEAARRLGYNSTSTLRQAANDGKLSAIKVGPRSWVTTEEDVRAWDATRRHSEGYARGGQRDGLRGKRVGSKDKPPRRARGPRPVKETP
jgi:hypothetical protein